MFSIFLFGMVFFIYEIIEQVSYFKRVKSIPIRIHVNGTRGKSTVTRLIAAGLREAGLRVLAKTTGTLPRLILEDGTEVSIKRKGRANIKEQLKIFSEAVKRKAEAVVIECMAVNPELQWVSEHRMIRSTIGAITNVREDHIDAVGPDPIDMAEALKLTIPENGVLVTSEKRHFQIFKEQSNKLKTKIIYANSDSISNEIIKKFSYMEFKENLSIALRICKLLGVNQTVALTGMLKAKPDPGVLRIYKLLKDGKNIYFINAFAANDASSALLIWDRIKKMEDINKLPIIGIINNREDRPFRAVRFGHILARKIIASKILLVGPLSKLTERALLKLKVQPKSIIDLGREKDVEKVLQIALKFTDSRAILMGFGNTKGMGQRFIEYFSNFGEIM
ncbi:MAG: poly-gamma-glutamate synthase PgsB [Candidatus Aerophobetes bacterium]|nr:poly-gamma-glutamate synthase PgsB [Candidatus Aerophobetes bacterium]